jgi:hypothetical protein
VNWTQAAASAPWSARYRFPLAVFDGKLWLCGGYDGTNHNDVWYTSGLGVEESHRPQASSRKLGPTIVHGTLRLPALLSAPCYLLAPDGRRVLSLRPGPNDVSHLAPGVYLAAAGGERSAAGVLKFIVTE